ncbi:MAG: 4Fe-4S binding protein [Clostridia bacterium]|nr:4Fe-4S binding protein [Clostridia bacterium]
MRRQKVRRIVLFISFLLFPVTIWYFSPYLIIRAASEHIVNGSCIVFLIMLIASLFLGRVWCGWLCPAGGMQECLFRCNDKPAKQGGRNNIKYVIFALWIISVIAAFLSGRKKVTTDFFYMTDHGISVSEISDYVIYYGVLLILILPALIHGRRGACHYLCWMAPFMVIGSRIGRVLHLPQLHIEAEKERCVSCGKCNQVCPMGLDVRTMTEKGTHAKCTECIQCGACVDECPGKALKNRMNWRQ